MAIFTAGPDTTVKLGAISLQNLLVGTVAIANATTFRIGQGQSFDELKGSNFTYDAGGDLQAGTITQWKQVAGGQTLFTITGLNLAVDTFLGFVAADDNFGLLAALLAGNDSITGSSKDDILIGFDGNDVVNAGAGDDDVDGGLGNDTLDGGAGRDVLSGLDGDDKITTGRGGVGEGGNAGNGGNGDDTLIGGADPDFLFGDDGNDLANGGGGNDFIEGGLGNDTLDGGAGFDFLLGGDGSDKISTGGEGGEGLGGAGNDTLTGGTGQDFLSGGVGDDLLEGGAGDDLLAGDQGADTMAGGAGNDQYVADNAGDVVTEAVNGGTDTVFALLVDHTLAANAENLTLIGLENIDGTGNGLNNVIIGNQGNNRLEGLAGNDTLQGLPGIDTLVGGVGNDTYVFFDPADILEENAGEGTDTVRSFVSVAALAENVENLVLEGSAESNGAGNGLANVISGNIADNDLDGLAGNDTLNGGDGNDEIDGGTGDDSMVGGKGGDFYFVDSIADKVIEAADSGDDQVFSSVSLTLAANVEDLTLLGTAAINGTGNTLANRLDGNDGANKLDGGSGNDILNGNVGNDSLDGGAGKDRLDGSTGNDTMAGGAGNDTYFVDGQGDLVIEVANQGFDFVISSVDIAGLAANVEGLQLSGNAVIGVGNALNNQITAVGSVDNLLDGGLGNDSLFGAGGKDTLIGGLGDDTYIIDQFDADDIRENAGEGTDTVLSFADFTALGENVENLVLGINANNGTGNTLANLMTGNDDGNALSGLGGKDTLNGGEGDDTLDGGAGADSMSGGKGDDVYVVDDLGDKTVEAVNAGIDQVQSSISLTLAANVENLLLLGSAGINGTGNALANRLDGNAGANKLDGGSGNDVLNGGLSSDTLLGGLGDDDLDAGFGDDSLDGGAGNDQLNGSVGADTMIGGAGNDNYLVNEVGDVVTELANGGIDRVFSSIDFTLGANFEQLALSGLAGVTGTGNALANLMTGNLGANRLEGLAGNDTLDGGGLDGDADTLVGGLGNDIYLFSQLGDTVIENAGEGTDTVESTVSIALSTLSANLENLKLLGTASINGTGNDIANLVTGNAGSNFLAGLAGNDTLDGGDGGDILNGGLGADSMKGGAGNDSYFVDDAGDKTVEAVNAGQDTVQTTITHTLAANVENLILQGIVAINGTGNGLANNIVGNIAANKLDGAAGNDNLGGANGDDTLIGGAGDDVLNGEAGNDSMAGGAGNDVYVVGDAGDVVTELAGQGTDTVLAVLSHTLAANVENLTLIGGGALNGVGNTLANLIIGNGDANILFGVAGNDTLDGGGNDGAADTLFGGLGNDTYIFDGAADTVGENAGEGTDTVESNISVSLFAVSGNVENLTLFGAANINGTGNALANVITGNDGINALLGLEGNDTLNGGAGNDALNGGAGNDSMSGGAGNDDYLVEDAGDKVSEAANGGLDEVSSFVSFTIGANIEILTLNGSDAINGTGNALGNIIVGNDAANKLDGAAGADDLNGLAGNDTLIGGAGNDGLDGGGGADSMSGGAGNDFYDVDDFGDVVSEAGGNGIDTVQSTVSFTLGAGLEDLLLIGGALDGTGNALANRIFGNNAGNRLDGAAANDDLFGNNGEDTLIGGTGNDTLSGGADSDTFLRVSSQDGKDTIRDFELGAGGDVLDIADVLVGFDVGDDVDAFVQLVESGGNTTVRIDANGAVGGANFVDAAVLAGVTGATVETMVSDGNLLLTG